MAKRLKDEELLLKIIINGDQGKKEMLSLERTIKDTSREVKNLEKQQKQLRAEGKKDTEQYKQLDAAIKQKNQTLELSKARLIELRKGMDLSKMSATDLRKEMRRLGQLRDSATPHTKAWIELDNQFKRVQKRHMELRGQQNSTGLSLKKMADKFNHYFGIIAAGAATVVGAISGIRKSIEEFTEIDDKISDVQRTTNLAREEVEGLRDSFSIKNFDTRTAEENLLSLATIAGKLGIDGSNNVEKFVKSSNSLVVALSEDLGGDVEETVREVGKLIDIFDITDEFPIDVAIQKTGSLINSLGMNSTASESRIVDFVKRTSGLSKTFGVLLPDAAGLAAVVDQIGASIETAGTTYNQIIPKMYKETETFARIGGMSYESFTHLLNTDVNEAFIRVLEGVKGNDGALQSLVGRLGDLGVDGARVTSVITSLANNTEKLRTEQAFAREEFEKGDSILKEYNLKNENAAAGLEKARKRMKEIRVELGEKLYPAMTFSTSSMSYFLKLLSLLIDFGKKYGKELTILTAAVVAYYTAQKIANINLASSTVLIKARVIWDKALRASTLLAAAAQAIFTGNVTRASAAMRLFNQVVKLNPLVLLISLLVAAGSALIVYSRRLSAVELAQRKLLKVEEEAQKAIIDEKMALEEKLKIARDENRSLSDRKKAMDEIQKISPDYLGNLSLETINTEKAKRAVDEYIESLLKKARVEAAQEKLKELAAREIELSVSGEEADANWWQKLIIGAAASASPSSAPSLASRFINNNFTKIREEIDTERQKLLDYINANQVTPKNTTVPGGSSGNPDGSLSEDEIKERYNAKLRIIQLGEQKITEELRRQWFARDISEREFRDRVQEYELAFLIAQKAAMEEAGMDTLSIQQSINDLQFSMTKEAFEKTAELKEKWLEYEKQILEDIADNVDEELAIQEAKDKKAEELAQKEIERLKKIEDARKSAMVAAIEAAAKTQASAIEEAKTMEDVGVAILNTIREIIKAYISQTIAVAIKDTFVKSGNPILGAILAPVAVAAVKGIFDKLLPKAQTKEEKANSVPGAEDGGYLSVVRSQDGKRFNAKNRPAKRGFINEPTLLVGEHSKEEFVANGMAVKNPTVRPVLDIIDVAQRNGSINSLNLLNVLERAYTFRARGMESGGYTQQPNPTPAAMDPATLAMLSGLKQSMDKLNDHLDKGIGVNPFSMEQRLKEKQLAAGPSLG